MCALQGVSEQPVGQAPIAARRFRAHIPRELPLVRGDKVEEVERAMRAAGTLQQRGRFLVTLRSMDPARTCRGSPVISKGRLRIRRVRRISSAMSAQRPPQLSTTNRMRESIFFAWSCPECGHQRPQRGLSRAALLRLLRAGHLIEAYCAACEAFWTVSPPERAAIAGELNPQIATDPSSHEEEAGWPS